MDDITRRSFNCVCGKYFGSKNSYTSHQAKCEKAKEVLIEGFDYVTCKICGFTGKSIAAHIKSHDISKSQYESQWGSTICKKSKEAYSDQRDGTNWITKAKDRGENIDEIKSKIGKAVSQAIMSDPNARKKRSETMTRLNKTKEFRDKSSQTAKKTSARPDIQKERGDRLAKWRDSNPEEFYEKCTKKMINAWQSRPEKELFAIVSGRFSFMKRNQQVKPLDRFLSTKTGRKQIDICSIEEKIAVEFDGPCHFRSFHGDDHLAKIQKNDSELNSALVQEGWTVIRISHDKYSYKKGEGFSHDDIEQIAYLIETRSRGLHLFGSLYKAQE